MKPTMLSVTSKFHNSESTLDCFSRDDALPESQVVIL